MALDWRRAAVALALLLGLMLGIPGIARADTVTLTGEDLRKATFVAADVSRLSDPVRGTRDLVLERVLQQLYARDPDLPADDAVKDIQALRAQVDGVLGDGETLRYMAPNQAIMAVLATLTDPLPAGEPGAAATRTMIDALDAVDDIGLSDKRFNPASDDLATLAVGPFSPAAVLRATFDRAAGNDRFRAARDALWGQVSGVLLTDTTPQMWAKKPDLFAPIVDAHGLPADGGSVQLTTETISEQLGKAVDGLNAVSDDAIAKAGTSMTDQERSDGAKAAQDAIERHEAEAAFDSTISAGNLRSKLDTVVTGARIAAGAYAQYSFKFFDGGGNTLRMMSSKALTGNLVLAAATIAMSFIPTGPSPEQLIFEQIVQLRKEIADFREEVGQDFADVDTALRGLDSKLDALSTEVGHVDDSVRLTLEGITEIGLQLDRLQANLLEEISDASQRTLWPTINFALGYSTRSASGSSLPENEFLQADSLFYTWATNSSLDSVALGSGRSFADEDVLGELSLPLERDVDYLSQWPANAGVTTAPLVASKVPNPKEWALGARAYAQLLLENPKLVTPQQRSRFSAILTVGNRLGALMTAIQQPSGEAGGTGNALFDALLSRYRGQAADLVHAIEAERDRYLADPAKSFGPDPDGGKSRLKLNLWGGVDHALDGDAMELNPGATVWSCGPAPTFPRQISTPKTFAADQRSAFTLGHVARRLGLGQLTTCWTAEWVGAADTLEWAQLTPVFGLRASVVSNMRTRFNWSFTETGGSTVHDAGALAKQLKPFVPSGFYSRAAGTAGTYDCMMNCESSSCDTCVHYAPFIMYKDWEGTDPWIDEWNGAYQEQNGWVVPQRKAAWEGGQMVAANVAMPADERTYFTDLIDAELRRRQREYYGRVAQALRTDSPVRKAAVALSGTKALIEAYAELGLAGPMAADPALAALISGPSSLLDDGDGARLSKLYTSLADSSGAWTGDLAGLADHDVLGSISPDDAGTESAGDVPGTVAYDLLSRADALERELRTWYATPQLRTARATVRRAAAASAPAAMPVDTLVSPAVNRLAVTRAVVDQAASQTPGPPPAQPGPPPVQPAPSPAQPGLSPVQPGPSPAEPRRKQRLTLHAKLQHRSFTRRRGTKLTLRTNRAVRVKAVLTRTAAGRRAHRHCVAPKKARHGKRCTRVLQRKRLRFKARHGRTVLPFGRGLKRGTWTLRLTASGGRPVRLTFSVR